MSTPSIATVITDAGFSLLRAAPGHKLIYTRAVCGSGHVEKTQLATLTEVMDYVMDLSIVEFGPTESAATLRLQLDNSKAPKEFQLYQIGIYAKLLDGEQELIGETLIQIMQYEEPDIVRAVPHVSEFVVNVLLGQAETVEGIIDMAAYVSIRQFSSRTVNGKPLSADVILTSEDIKVSDSDPTTVKTALSNKVTGGFTIYRDPGLDLDMDLSTITMDTLFATMPSNSMMIAGMDSSWNTDEFPAATGTLIAVSQYQGRKFAIFNTAGLSDLWIGSMGSSFSGWAKIALAEPPQEYELPLTSYVTELYGCRYSRDQFGRVVCYGTMTPTREITSGITIATLPAGYRPTNALRVAGIVVDQSGIASVIGIGIATTGEVSVRGDTVPSTAQYVSFSVVFQGG